MNPVLQPHLARQRRYSLEVQDILKFCFKYFDILLKINQVYFNEDKVLFNEDSLLQRRLSLSRQTRVLLYVPHCVFCELACNAVWQDVHELAPSLLIVFPTHFSQLLLSAGLLVPAEQGSEML